MKAIALVVGLAACNSERVPTCAEVTDHVLEVVTVKYPGHGDMGAGGTRQSQIDACETRKLPAGERRCIMAAKTMEAVAQCRRAGMTEGSAPKP